MAEAPLPIVSNDCVIRPGVEAGIAGLTPPLPSCCDSGCQTFTVFGPRYINGPNSNFEGAWLNPFIGITGTNGLSLYFFIQAVDQPFSAIPSSLLVALVGDLGPNHTHAVQAFSPLTDIEFLNAEFSSSISWCNDGSIRVGYGDAGGSYRTYTVTNAADLIMTPGTFEVVQVFFNVQPVEFYEGVEGSGIRSAEITCGSLSAGSEITLEVAD